MDGDHIRYNLGHKKTAFLEGSGCIRGIYPRFAAVSYAGTIQFRFKGIFSGRFTTPRHSDKTDDR